MQTSLFPKFALAASLLVLTLACGSQPRGARPVDASTGATKPMTEVAGIVAEELDGTAARPAAPRATDSLRVTIFGDSYSTFQGWLSCDTNEVWYPAEHKVNDVRRVEDTWWHQVIDTLGWRLERNNSFSGATVCYTGYRREDYSNRSFVNRLAWLGDPDVILCCAATNDSWCGAPIGDYQYANWTREDLFAFRPAMSKLCEGFRTHYPRARVVFILNSELKPEINESVEVICRHYGIELLRLHDIDKQSGHPSVAGMRAFARQVIDYLRPTSVK